MLNIQNLWTDFSEHTECSVTSIRQVYESYVQQVLHCIPDKQSKVKLHNFANTQPVIAGPKQFLANGIVYFLNKCWPAFVIYRSRGDGDALRVFTKHFSTKPLRR